MIPVPAPVEPEESVLKPLSEIEAMILRAPARDIAVLMVLLSREENDR